MTEPAVNLQEMSGYRTDKQPSFLAVYESLFAPLRERPVALLELGIHHGGSLLMWRDYFAQGSIAGLDQFACGRRVRRRRHEVTTRPITGLTHRGQVDVCRSTSGRGAGSKDSESHRTLLRL